MWCLLFSHAAHWFPLWDHRVSIDWCARHAKDLLARGWRTPHTRWRFVNSLSLASSKRRKKDVHWLIAPTTHIHCDLLDVMRSLLVRPLFGKIQTHTPCANNVRDEENPFTYVYVAARNWVEHLFCARAITISKCISVNYTLRWRAKMMWLKCSAIENDSMQRKSVHRYWPMRIQYNLEMPHTLRSLPIWWSIKLMDFIGNQQTIAHNIGRNCRGIDQYVSTV